MLLMNNQLATHERQTETFDVHVRLNHLKQQN